MKKGRTALDTRRTEEENAACRELQVGIGRLSEGGGAKVGIVEG